MRSSPGEAELCGSLERLRLDLVRVTNQPKECTMQLNPYLLFNRQCEAAFKFKDRRLIRFEFLQQETVLYEEL